MNPLVIAALSFVVVAAVVVVTALVLTRQWLEVPRERLSSRATPEVTPVSILRWQEEPPAGIGSTIEQIGRRVEPKDVAKRSRYRQQLGWAGYHNPRALPTFMGAKLVMALAGLFIYPIYSFFQPGTQAKNVVAIALFMFVIGFFLPDVWLRSRVQARQREITNTLPDTLDLLMVCVEAGMGFDAAVARVADQPEMRDSALHQEMLRMHLEMRAGRPRAEALRAFADRTGVNEIRSLVGAFIQTDRLGTPLGKTLRVHAESARIERRHRAEERAYLAPLKMIFPTVLFLMPAFFLVAMAPSVLALARAFQTLTK
jgi:tight adherence protein C